MHKLYVHVRELLSCIITIFNVWIIHRIHAYVSKLQLTSSGVHAPSGTTPFSCCWLQSHFCKTWNRKQVNQFEPQQRKDSSKSESDYSACTSPVSHMVNRQNKPCWSSVVTKRVFFWFTTHRWSTTICLSRSIQFLPSMISAIFPFNCHPTKTQALWLFRPDFIKYHLAPIRSVVSAF